MNEKEAIEKLNEILEEWQQILNVEDKVDREIEMSMYFEDMPFIEIQTVLQGLKDKDNRIDELEKALIDEDFKYKEKIKQYEEQNKEYLNAIKSILLNIPSNQIEINNKDIVQAEKYYVVVERNVINNSQKLCLYKGGV